MKLLFQVPDLCFISGVINFLSLGCCYFFFKKVSIQQIWVFGVLYFVNFGVMDMETCSFDREETFLKNGLFFHCKLVCCSFSNIGRKRTIQKRTGFAQYTHRRYVTLPWLPFGFLENIECNIEKIS